MHQNQKPLNWIPIALNWFTILNAKQIHCTKLQTHKPQTYVPCNTLNLILCNVYVELVLLEIIFEVCQPWNEKNMNIAQNDGDKKISHHLF